MEAGGNEIIVMHCYPAKYPKRDGFTKVLKRLWGSNCFSYTKLGHNAMVARFIPAEACDKVLRTGPWLCDDWVILVDSYDEGVLISHIRINRFRAWAHLYNLPPGYFSKEMLQKVWSDWNIY